MIGINDILSGQPVDRIFDNYRKIVYGFNFMSFISQPFGKITLILSGIYAFIKTFLAGPFKIGENRLSLNFFNNGNRFFYIIFSALSNDHYGTCTLTNSTGGDMF